MNNKVKLVSAFEARQPKSNISEIARKYRIKRNNIYYYMNYFNNDYGDNHNIRNQVLLGSKLGDGYFQKLKNNKYKYRETHSIKEKEYAMWKYLILDDLAYGTSMIDKDDGNSVEIYTNAKSSEVIKEYALMPLDDVIKNIDIYGLLIWILDDGWYSNHSTAGNIVIGSKKIAKKHKLDIIEIFSSYNIDVSLIGKKQDLSINSKDNFILLAYLNKIMFTIDIDVIKKKFGNIYNQAKHGIVYSLS